MGFATESLKSASVARAFPLRSPDTRAALTRWLAHGRGWISIVVIAPAGVVSAFSPLRYAPGTWGCFFFEAAGWLLFLVGAGFRWWSTLYIGGRKEIRLVSDGPYSLSRNPIYLGTFLLTLAAGVLTRSALFLLAVVLVSAAYVAFTVTAEEERLIAIYGDEFRRYCERVPRFIPRFRLFHSTETIEVQIRGLRAELIRTCRWVWIPILCDLVTHLRSEAWWPVWFSSL